MLSTQRASSWLQNNKLEIKMLEFPASLIFQKLQRSLVQCNFFLELQLETRASFTVLKRSGFDIAFTLQRFSVNVLPKCQLN